jgi:hypothetical protein
MKKLLLIALLIMGCEENSPGSDDSYDCWESNYASNDDNLELISVEGFEDGQDDNVIITISYTLQSLDEAYLVPTCEGSSSSLETYQITKGTGDVSVSVHYIDCQLGIVKMRISPNDEYCDHNDPSNNNSCIMYCKFYI